MHVEYIKDHLSRDYGESIYLDRYIQGIIKYRNNIPVKNYEKHHILPKSLYPEHEKNKDNIILLGYREHYLAHYLLYKITNTYSMAEAFKLMRTSKSKNSRLFEIEKERIYKMRKNHCVYYNKETNTNELINLNDKTDKHIHPLRGCRMYYDTKNKVNRFVTIENKKEYYLPVNYGGKHERIYWNGNTRSCINENNKRTTGYECGLSILNDPTKLCFLDIKNKKYVRLCKNTNEHKLIPFSGHNLNKVYIIRFNGVYFLSRKYLPAFLKDRTSLISKSGLEIFMNSNINKTNKKWSKNENKLVNGYVNKKYKIRDLDIEVIYLNAYEYNENHTFILSDADCAEFIKRLSEEYNEL